MVALTWNKARAILRDILIEYLQGPFPRVQATVYTSDHDAGLPRSFPLSRCMDCWLKNDMDLCGAAPLLSIGLLIIACFAWVSSDKEGGSLLNASARKQIYLSQLSASILLAVSSVTCIWMVRRRYFACSRDVDSVKRREIQRFLKAMERHTDEKSKEENANNSIRSANNSSIRSTHNPLRRDSSTSATPGNVDGMTLPLSGTSLTDVYPVYRLSEGGQGSWSRLPTLLLVKGDQIALHVGDIAPAKCTIASEDASSNSTAIIEGRERVTLESFGGQPPMAFPKGRTTIPSESGKLLELCNSLRVFALLESPMHAFLRQELVQHKVPQVLRQLRAVRASLSVLSLLVFATTTIIIFTRPDITSVDISFILPIPFLAALGVLPVCAPAFLIFLEILGTAKILVAVHPHSSRFSPPNSASAPEADGVKDVEGIDSKDRFPLLARYVLATTLSRLSLKEMARKIRLGFRSIKRKGWPHLVEGDITSPKIIRVPPASVYLLEKLGVATAFTMVDDELACEPHALPQQLLIPSGKGLKLLDMCPIYEDDSGDESVVDTSTRKKSKSFDMPDHDSDSDSDDPTHSQVDSSRQRRKKKKIFRLRRKPRPSVADSTTNSNGDHTGRALPMDQEVQFEDPNWWQHLPALKCIGLACLVVDDKVGETDDRLLDPFEEDPTLNGPIQKSQSVDLEEAREDLVRLISAERRSNQLRALANCIGFTLEPNSHGDRGDISSFAECLRLHVISTQLVKERLAMDPHERGSEEARWWGLLKPDSTSVIIRDARSNAYQLLTAGDPEVVTTLCHEAWQGENSTILPLASADRATILQTSKSWKLADLDVSAFSYAPIPHTVENRLGHDGTKTSRHYLLDNSSRPAMKGPISLKDKTLPEEWRMINNQIFLGVLGSLVVPRKEIQHLLSTLSDAGVRFVYFSPRNMRRQKELASQMGIDVAWNCAISLRPLESGEDDPHRMVSNYADWDVNAKLPHGLDNVRKHLRDVDNVPLLVSLFTDVTKETTKGMIETFQEYADTVIAVGLSHLPRNSGIFSSADISVAIDVLAESIESVTPLPTRVHSSSYSKVLPSEVTFCSAISSHACVFRLGGATATSHIPDIIAHGRAALEAAVAAVHYYICSCLSFSFFMLFTVCSVSTAVPYVPSLGAVCYLLFLLPLVGFTLGWSDPDKESMNRVPPKNDQNVTFGRNERGRLFMSTLLKSIPPACFPQLMHLIAYGELMIKFEPEYVHAHCAVDVGTGDWAQIVRCSAMKEYSGVARTSAGAFVLAELILCTLIVSATFVHGTIPLQELPPWTGNTLWAYCLTLGLGLLAIILSATVERGSFSALPWYYYVVALVMPAMCVAWNEYLKRIDRKHELRAEKLRRLQFETRLGMWSPR